MTASIFRFPATRASGGSRLRWEDFTPMQLQGLKRERTALYMALREELQTRRALAVGNFATTATDTDIRRRLETFVKSARAVGSADEVKRALDDWTATVRAIERVTPSDPIPPRAA